MDSLASASFNLMVSSWASASLDRMMDSWASTSWNPMMDSWVGADDGQHREIDGGRDDDEELPAQERGAARLSRNALSSFACLCHLTQPHCLEVLASFTAAGSAHQSSGF